MPSSKEIVLGKSDRSMKYSKLSVISWVALPPYSGLNLNPFQIPGLWLAVIMIAPAALFSKTLKLRTGVGIGPVDK